MAMKFCVPKVPGKGLISYIKNGLPYSPVSFDIEFEECLSIEVKLSSRGKL